MASLILAMLAVDPADGGTGASSSHEATTVVTGTRTPEEVQRATVKTDVVSREEAERRGATNVAEALASQPGVQVNPGAYGYLGGVSAIQIQGFDLNRVLVLEDGEPVIGDVGGAIDLASIPITDLARIEVVAGPTSALYGSSAIGGVVNLITAPPRTEGPSARLRTEYRSHNGVVLQGNGAIREGAGWLALDLGLTRQDGVSLDPALPDQQIPRSNRLSGGVRAGVTLGDSVDVQVKARWLHQNLDGLESSTFPGLGRFLTDLPSVTDRYALQLIETIRFAPDSTIRLAVAGQDAVGDASNVPRGSPLRQTQHTQQVMQSFEGTVTVADGPRSWVVGARYDAQSMNQHLEQVERSGDGLVTLQTPEVAERTLETSAVYAQLLWRFGRWLTVGPGVRAEYHGAYGSVLAPRLALAFRPTRELTVRVAAGRGFRTPSAEELGFNFDHSIYGYRVVGNPALKPESSWGINGDVTAKLGEHWSLRAGGFANWVDGLIDIDLGGGVTNGSVVTYSYRNFERVRTLGAQAGAGFRWDDTLQVEVAYDYLWTRDDTNDVPLSGRPPHTLTLSVRAQLPWKLELYARGHLVSDAYVDDTTRSPGYETVDLRLGRELWPRSQLYAGLLNLLDDHQRPGVVGDLRPPLGRVLYAGLRSAFPWEEP
ncbi:MAG: TonB-dependent receptor [Myxococcaceae bacterium]